MFNSMSSLPFIPYNIVKYLTQDEILWKLLKYESYDALSKPDLTYSEKLQLIWTSGPQEKYNIFLTNLIEDAIAESKTILKIYQYYIEPDNPYSADVVYAFDCLYGGQSSLVEYNNTPVNRGDLFINRLLTILNGATIDGVGKMIFARDLSRYCVAKSIVGNSKTFTGECIYLGVKVGDKGVQSDCD